MIKNENLQFGDGHFVGLLNDPAFHELPVREQARIVGWADSCPVVSELTDPNNPDPRRGSEAMLERYGEINAWFTFIGQAIQEVKPHLYNDLMTPVRRLPGEPVGKYETESVPENHTDVISPLGTLPGYALPRLLIKQIGNGSVEENQTRLMKGLASLDLAIETAETPAELLASFAGNLARAGDLPSETVLAGTLSKGWLGEHNAISMLNDVKEALSTNAPDLWSTYIAMTGTDRAGLKIA